MAPLIISLCLCVFVFGAYCLFDAFAFPGSERKVWILLVMARFRVALSSMHSGPRKGKQAVTVAVAVAEAMVVFTVF